MDIEFKSLDKKYKEDVLKLVLKKHASARKFKPFLPNAKYYKQKYESNINQLFKIGNGIVALEQGELKGFLIGYEVDELFGKDKGIYVPLYGHAVIEEMKNKLYQKMYTKAADLWVKQERLNHTITIFSHDKEVVNTWFWMGFGLRCVDAMQELKNIKEDKNVDIEIRKAAYKDIDQMEDLYKKNNQYYEESPLFMPVSTEEGIEGLKDWYEKENHHLWIAYKDNKVVGFIRIQPNGETVISEHPEVMNITGAYVDDKYRKQRIGISLVNTIFKWLKENEYKLCGVDFESINIIGSNFWLKYFIPYTHSLVRHIDDRIVD